MSEPTITDNLGLYLVQHNKRLREIRRELRRLERRAFWARIKARIKGGKKPC
jgi:hypothetical protein